jgi:predicted DNA-binding protein with PD1-like motif
MQSRPFGEGAHRSYFVTFEPGDEAVQGLGDFARQEAIDVASFTAIGGFEAASLGFFNLETRGFDEIPLHEDQVEVLSLIGEITSDDGEPKVHAHVVVGRRDGTTRGGHLLRGVVRPILIVTLNELPHTLEAHHGEGEFLQQG